MITLKGAYYIDEISELLIKAVGREVVDAFYEQNITYTISNLQEYINQHEVAPLLKVAWNIINRGDATRASLKLSSYLLKKHFPNQSDIVHTKSDIKGSLSLFQNTSKVDIESLLTNFRSWDSSQASEFGLAIYGLYNYLKDSILFAQLQKTMLLVFMTSPSKSYFKINGLSDEENTLIQEDLNELVQALLHLSHKSEHVLYSLEEKEGHQKIDISINGANNRGIQLSTLVPNQESTLNFKILTDRRVKYKKLGKVVVSEKELKNGGKGEYQSFEYETEKQRLALLYFLQNIFRKVGFKPGQEAIINRALVGEDVIGLLPTGGGKSLTFQLCALLHPGVTVVVDPINSLMKDQHDKLLDNGISNATFINSFNTKEERNERMNKLIEGQYLFLFVSPERFQMENFRQYLNGCRNLGVYFSYAVIDEAHCVSEWGHDFRHVYLNLAENLRRHCLSKSGRLTIFGLTATASFDVLADVQRELRLKEDAIASLPAEAIDRVELNYRIIPISLKIEPGLNYLNRERTLGGIKYPVIKDLLRQMPLEISRLEKAYGYINKTSDFYGIVDGKYKNAGVVFCPTKSTKLPNGVMHLTYGRDNLGGGLNDLPFIEARTFFGGGDDDVILDAAIEEQADESYNNQDEFIKDKANLMIATKAFGMGIDKPNIRFSIHYSTPNSVESFYQESGRAGRDGNPSLCSIIYHPADFETNYDFYQNAFKGVQRERLIIDELLKEVQYEDGFFVSVIDKIVKEKYPAVGKISLWENRYLNVFGIYGGEIRIGKIDLNHQDLTNYDNWRQNFDQGKADEILNYIREVITKERGDTEVLTWLKTKSKEGIRTLIESGARENYVLKIGFTNGVVSEINSRIKELGYNDFKERVIRAAYNFSSDENDFIANINYQYHKFQVIQYGAPRREFNLNIDTENYIRESFYKIRNSQDTQRAIYRLNILGIIDDYVIDYVGKVIEVRFTAKSDSQYKSNFQTYLRRYLGIEKTKMWLDKLNTESEDSILTQVLYVLIEFIESEIADKRKRAIDYMGELCEVYLKEGEREFRDRMIRYFTSKYARADYLPKDTERGTIENCAIVKKYIEYLDKPPDGLGGPIDNAKHLRGACDNLRINMKQNASIDLLTAFSLFALELKEDDTMDSMSQKPLVAAAVNLYRSGFRRMLQIDTWAEVKSLIELFNFKTLDFNSEIKPLLELLSFELYVNRTHFKLKNFIDKISEK